MGHAAFFAAAALAGLLWTAACTAAARRLGRPLGRGLFVALGVALPILVLLPWLLATASLAVADIRPNWLAAVSTVVVGQLLGGILIAWRDLEAWGAPARPSVTNPNVASRWPVIGLFAMFLAALAAAIGTLLLLDQAVAAEVSAMRVEAGRLLQAALPPAPAAGANAAGLHVEAGAAIAAAPELAAVDGPLRDAGIDVTGPVVGDCLARHAPLVDLIRRAADMPGCRFPRDWSRPAVSMPLPEVAASRDEVRLLALAARREAAEGRHAEAIADAVRIGRIGRQIGSEPILISWLVSLAIDATALSVVADILPRLGPDDDHLLDDPGLRDLVGSAPSLAAALAGEEAFGLSIFADHAEGHGTLGVDDPDADATAPTPFSLGVVWRVFLLPADVAGYRERLGQFRLLAETPIDHARGWPGTRDSVDGVDAALRRAGGDGALSRQVMPAMEAVFRARHTAVVRHRAAEVLVAATRERLATGTLPAAVDALVPARLPAVPRDPFAGDAPLRTRVTAGEWAVWSVGPNGIDDGGPQTAAAERLENGDDVGLTMRAVAP
ncbi:MAG: hypothetical protein ACKO5R_05840 [Planctomycetaceae bacterium]